MSDLKLYNSLTRQKEVFEPIDPAHVRMYACGPTVYNYAHIGNARMAVVFDLWARVLRHLYPKVTYVSNITDVDDKIMIASRETGVPINQITEKYTGIYNEDMAYLGVQQPDIQPRATAHIGEMIDLCEKLIERGHAYAAEGHVLFDVPSDPSYGALSGRSRDEQIAGARVDIAPYKKDAADFVLWKPSSDDEPGWDSPWGRGRPGWHIECSAMAEKHLGLPFDIHGGGADLKFPHHENEIAQSCCAHGNETAPDSFAKYWAHNGFVTVEGQKMSKSLGNCFLVHDLKDKYCGATLRFTLLSAHYRQPLDWSADKLHQNAKLVEKLKRKIEDLNRCFPRENGDLSGSEQTPAFAGEAPSEEIPSAILDALCDDLNTPKVIAELNVLLKAPASPTLKHELETTLTLLGILHNSKWVGEESVADTGRTGAQNESSKAPDPAAIDALLTQRTHAKANKDYARADEIRDELAAQGIEIIDTADGVSWKTI